MHPTETLLMKSLLKLTISKKKPKVKSNTSSKETGSDIKPKSNNKTSKRDFNNMNTVPTKWIKMSKKKRKSKILSKNNNTKSKAKAERSKA